MDMIDRVDNRRIKMIPPCNIRDLIRYFIRFKFRSISFQLLLLPIIILFYYCCILSLSGIYDWDNFHFVCELSLFFFYLIITIILLRHAVIFQLYLEPDRKSSDTISASLYSIELHLSLTE